MSSEKRYKVQIGSWASDYPEGTQFFDILKDYPEREKLEEKGDIILANVNGVLRELFKRLKEDANIIPITTMEKIGMDVYQRSVTFLLIKSVYDVLGADVNLHVEFMLGRGLYCELHHYDRPITEELLERLKARMKELVDLKLPFYKDYVRTETAQKIFRDFGQKDKEKLFRFRLASGTNLYELDGYQDYFYGYMATNTDILKYYDLLLYDQGILLMFPELNDPRKVAEKPNMNKFYGMLREADSWGKMAGVDTVGDLNELLISGAGNELILIQESMQEKKIGDIAAQIATEHKVKFVMIAGPSSSGKTSFANRLAIQLKTFSCKPHLISMDNFFVNREDTPRDENGEHDYEALETVDVPFFNQTLQDLLDGKAVEMPTYNFLTGTREFHGDILQIGESDIIIVEGIHALNPKILEDIPREYKFKIFISALITLNVDSHNRIPTTDGRLIRRMVRDARTRGESAQDTIARWPSVRRGEEKYIFPYQETADIMFNSSLIYELAVEKQYCERILYSVPQDSPEFREAKRLLKFLGYIVGFESDRLPSNSLVREFVGGSCFNV